ncbi:MAG: enoyl-CoA hydratase [Betaproteobacteria bacterium]|nr:enoyl-CoA hydratase [Betaproteobacteria bacterium]
MNDTVLLAIDGPIATITLNRPAQLNALNDAMMFGLRDALALVEQDANIRVVILKGAGKAFMAGGDVAMFHEKKDEVSSTFHVLGGTFHESIKMLRRMSKPVIASVQGACAGGGLSVMLACDLAVAAESSQFTLAYARIGVSPDGGSTHFLPRIVGARKALELALLTEAFGADKALEMGLVNRVVPASELEPETLKLAHQLASGPSRAFAHTKALINASFDRPMDAQLDAEVRAFADCATGHDFKEGVTAFVEKRKPRFRGE